MRGLDNHGAELLARGWKAAFAFRDMDEEPTLAALAYDSVMDDGALIGARAAGRARTVLFEADAVSIEIEVTEAGLVGQVAPAGSGSVLARSVDGVTSSAETDDESPDHKPALLGL